MLPRSISATTNPRTLDRRALCGFGGNDFFYYPAGDSLAIYRIEPPADTERGPTLKLASVSGELPAGGPIGVHRDETWRARKQIPLGMDRRPG